MKAKISEIFKSIQGEGVYQGMQQIFIRFYGCNLDCKFCDTKLLNYKKSTVDDVLKEISIWPDCKSLALTGGEPLLHADFIQELAYKLKPLGYSLYLETNGTLPELMAKINGCIDIVSMDFKLPSSTGMKNFWVEHSDFLNQCKLKNVFVKAVISPESNTGDLFEAIKLIKKIKQDVPFVLQPQNPLEEKLEGKLSSFKTLCKLYNINVRVIEQLHKKLNIR